MSTNISKSRNEIVESLYGDFEEFDGEGFARLYNTIMNTLYKIRMTPVESQVFWYIVRFANGFNKRFTEYGFNKFIDETGIQKENIYRALRGLYQKNIIRYGFDHRDVKYYGINPKCQQWCKEDIKTDSYRIKIDTDRIRSDTEIVRNDTQVVSKSTPLLHTRGSTNRSYTHISQRNESNQNDYSLERMIQYAARTCSLTIIGKNEATLKQLMKRHPDNRITEAMGNFALYQLEEMEGRRFPIGKTFDAFVRKFDLFADAESVDRRLTDERRWFREQAKERQKTGPDGMPVSSQSQPEENTEPEEQSRVEFMLNLTQGIEKGARERGVTVGQLLGPDQNTLWKYNLFKKRLEAMPIEDRSSREYLNFCSS